MLGRTGVKVPIIAFGCGSRFLMYESTDEALRALNHVIDSGVTYLDTAMDYGKGLSETRVGMLMTTRRKRSGWRRRFRRRPERATRRCVKSKRV